MAAMLVALYGLGALFSLTLFIRLDPRPPRGAAQVLNAVVTLLLWPVSLPVYALRLLRGKVHYGP